MSNTDPNSGAPDLAIRGQGVDYTADGKISLSSSDAASRLISDYLWQSAGAPLTITYAFRRDGAPPDDASSGFDRFNAQQIATTEQALAAWAAVANINFVRVDDGDGYSDNATILFGDYLTGPDAGFTILPTATDPADPGGDVWINVGESYNAAPVAGNYGALTLIHEIGHALGLQHPSDYTTLDFASDASYAQDTLEYTVMSYFAADHGAASYENGPFPFTPEVDDIAAVQQLFGANAATNAGDTVYGFNATLAEPWFDYGDTLSTGTMYAVWDAGGNDTFDFSQSSVGVSIDLRPGGISTYWANSGIYIPDNVLIENAIGGTGSNTIIGNAASNILRGGNGGNYLYGEGGDDTLIGGTGTDYLDGGSGTNMIDGVSGTDSLILPGTLFDYATTQNGDGSYTISGHGVVDIVKNITYVDLAQNRIYGFTSFVAATHKTSRSGHHNAAANDFDGDANGDLLVRNANGTLAVWSIISPAAPTSNLPPGLFIPQLVAAQKGTALAVDPSWNFVATMDFNGDGSSDIVFRTLDGSIAIWTGGSGGFDQQAYRGPAVGYDWAIAAVGDVNGDGKDDLVWRSRTGAIELWLSTGTGFLDAGAPVAPAMDASWTLAALADFNGDGRADFLWQKADGTVAVWLGQGDGFQGGSFFDGSVDPSWQLVGAADFNGDGKDDLLWRDGASQLQIWLSTGATFQRGSIAVGALPAGLQVVQLEDINRDGKADILLSGTEAGSIATAAFVSQSGAQAFSRTGLTSDVTVGIPAIVSPTAAVFDPLGFPAVSDFDGDGHSDILWRNANGALSTWAVTGNAAANQVRQGAYNGSVDPSWKIAETFDFDGDGRTDILWRQAGGAVAIWGSTDGGFSSSTYYRASPVPLSWQIAATGDLNGDGRDDILWQNADGSLSSWSSTGTGFQEASYTHASVGKDWVVEALGDFNGDGAADMLWRNTNGAVAVWSNAGQGTAFNEGAFYQPGVATSWHIDGVGDFNGDGRDDILWRNDNGQMTLWTANGQGFDEGIYTTQIDTRWHIAEVGDLNGDGRADIVWQNDNGQISTWQSNGTGFDQSVYNASAPVSWSIAAHHYAL